MSSPYPQDPDSPYFEHLYAVAKELNPDLDRDTLLAVLREIDPEDEMRISAPLSSER